MQAVMERPPVTCSDGANVPPVPPVRTGNAGSFDPNDPFYAVVRSYYSAAAPCGHPDGCDRPADYDSDFHGCSQHLLCEAHLSEWLEGAAILIKHGGVLCPSCNRLFRVMGALVSPRRL